ncbi:MAG: methylenetetrahydrofolate reductase [NAD(P)H] [Deltaproteobacteria bacterium]|nr:methylenetetrahydrofolate reductase [NAD(P)H] [Deltaproteobacteria bacterium]MBI4373350.1 methylenetetrahydrofolate reductase [NAD(P)H] [Deltaproteobacteria bacterium]
MNFQDFYQKGRPQFSFEIFPPKNEAGFQDLLAAMKELSCLHPAFISVTYGAMGSTQALTRDLALRIHRELGLTTAFHFTCVGSDRESIQNYVEQLKKEGLHLIVALRGDPPEGTKEFVPKEDGFRYAAQLVRFLKELGGFSIAVAGYPEGHVEAPDPETDLINLKLKVQAGADIVITQLFFDNQDFFNFQNRARQIGIKVPVIPGIMPIVNLKQIEKITRMCGARVPEALHEKLLRNESDPEAIREIGIQHAILQCRELIERGSPGIHFYTLNKAYSVGKVVRALPFPP